jgi:hypothetical protein
MRRRTDDVEAKEASMSWRCTSSIVAAAVHRHQHAEDAQMPSQPQEPPQTPQAEKPPQGPQPLKFKVASHIVEDLGLNLYTSLPRVLVEFIANAYDADSTWVDVRLDLAKISEAREAIKATYKSEQAVAKRTGRLAELEPLANRTLPDATTIVIEDGGCGMSRADLERKFLITGRRRRKEEPELHGRTPGGRPLMGRKGLGKLAGFGVGRTVEVTTRKTGEPHATQITLAYDALAEGSPTDEIPIPEKKLDDGGGLPSTGGTRIVLSNLLYDPTETDGPTINGEIAEHFELIEPSEYSIKLNGVEIARHQRPHDFAWPKPELPVEGWATHQWEAEDGRILSFKYRMRFTARKHALLGSRRGVRVYAHNRLASAPSLLKADTNMHGFRMTDYLDAVVHADFIDDEPTDYIATNRQSLRWESPLLTPMHRFLSEEIREACTACQKHREDESPHEVKIDSFTKDEIGRYAFSKRDEKVAYKIAAALNSVCKQGVDDKDYKTNLPVLIESIGHGNVMAAISSLAALDHPDLNRVALEVGRLRRVEIDQLVTNARGRLSAIKALNKIVKDVNFKDGHDEKTVQKLLERSPWLIAPGLSSFVTADQQMDTLVKRLTKELKVGVDAPTKIDPKERPDLVFLLGSDAAARIVIIELKAPNLMLDSDDLDQLINYIEEVSEWLEDKGKGQVRVTGQLIGSTAPPRSTGRKIRSLRSRTRTAKNEPWVVRDFVEVLADTEEVHREIIAAYKDEDDEVGG